MKDKFLEIMRYLRRAVDFARPGNVKALYSRYEPYVSPLALFFGFVLDNLTLRRVDLWAENIIIISYLAVAFGSIIYLSAYEAGRLKRALFIRAARFAPFVLQFVFGGLFSAFFVFYNRSASLSASWPFLLVILALLAGNERFRERYQRLAFRLCVFFMALFSYAVFAVPIIVSGIGPGIFILSGLTALLLLALAAAAARRTAPEIFRKSRFSLAAGALIIYLAFNFFYFLNLIPPIPLAVRESGVYHEIRRTGNGYEITYEPVPWYMFWRGYSPVFHWRPGEPVYFYTAVFAPTDFSVRIYHRWQYYDEALAEWKTESRLGFPVTGGRDGGYRGYSYKYGVRPGRWRVDTVTERGQIMGRAEFTIIDTAFPPELRTGSR